MLVASDIRVRLGRTPVLHGIDLNARAGQVTAIVGPNGSGKSTLLRALSGDLPGDVTLDGIPLATLRPWQLAALRAVLPQSTPLAFPFTAAEIVRLGLTASPRGVRPDLPVQALAAVGLQDRAETLFQELSGGQQARVQLARALVQVWDPVLDGTPRWLMLDEPVASLDIAHQLSVMRLARDFAARGGGVIALMHDLNLTAAFADRVYLLAAGRVLATGSPAEVLADGPLSAAYGCPVAVGRVPAPGIPFVLPHAAGAF